MQNNNHAKSTVTPQPRVFTSERNNRFQVRDFYDPTRFHGRKVDRVIIHGQTVQLVNGAYISREKAKVLAERLKEAIKGGRLDNTVYKTSMAEAIQENFSGSGGYFFYCYNPKEDPDNPKIQLEKIVDIQPPYD